MSNETETLTTHNETALKTRRVEVLRLIKVLEDGPAFPMQGAVIKHLSQYDAALLCLLDLNEMMHALGGPERKV